ncbi:LemA family protein [Luteimonas granuli]|uniref:LemA family protein n=1 Tax=Luteimonas granuli TaxID=1176533 RepID=UPI001FECB0D7|nr:LemA family protein [Luteimonas granuli]
MRWSCGIPASWAASRPNSSRRWAACCCCGRPYPDLKASENFARLQDDLVDVEEHLQYARRYYNGAVRDLNDAVQRVPDVLVARSFGFGEAAFFQAAADSRAAPMVELS